MQATTILNIILVIISLDYLFNLVSGDHLMRINGGKLQRTLFVVMNNE